MKATPTCKRVLQTATCNIEAHCSMLFFLTRAQMLNALTDKRYAMARPAVPQIMSFRYSILRYRSAN